jgi:oligopeptide/dipeptide ABC transporter ATP-binding protein
MKKRLLSVQNLHVRFATSRGSLHAVRGIDFHINEGETLGIVGESGCGKSAAIKALIRLGPRETTTLEGKILYQGEDLLTYPESKIRSVRGKEISMIFQDPMSSLNPTMTIGKQILEGYLQHFPLTSKQEARLIALEMLEKVGISSPKELFDTYPHMLSGGMRQRVMIAIALACKPKILLADEPTTALDVTIQAQILDLLKTIQMATHTSIVIITHDLSVIASMCDRVLVMYAGQIIESASVERLFSSPQHPYTQRLLAAIPHLEQPKEQPLLSIEGAPPNLMYPLKGCSFCSRCTQPLRICSEETPPLFPIAADHLCACFQHDKRRSR